MAEDKKKEMPVYEHLAPNECMIISKTDKDILVACNSEGDIKVKRVPLPKRED